MKVNIYFDGAYLGKIIKQSGLSVDLNKLASILSEGDTIDNIYYYNCLPFRHEKSPPEEMVLFTKVQKFYNMLAQQPKFTIKLGSIAKVNGIFVQKGVDTMIAVDMTTAAMNKEVDRLILVSGDRDFVPVAKNIINIGSKVTIWLWVRKFKPQGYDSIGYNNIRLLDYSLLKLAERH